MNVDANLVIESLLNQISVLSKEKAVLYAMVKQKEQEIEELKKKNAE